MGYEGNIQKGYKGKHPDVTMEQKPKRGYLDPKLPTMEKGTDGHDKVCKPKSDCANLISRRTRLGLDTRQAETFARQAASATSQRFMFRA